MAAAASDIPAASASEVTVDDEVETWTHEKNVSALREKCKTALKGMSALHREDSHESLSRWLVARKGDVDAAAKMLDRHAKWRNDSCAGWYHAGKVPPLSTVQDSIKTGKAEIIGKIAATGSPLVYIDVEKHDCYAISEAETQKYTICMLEHAIAQSYRNGGNGQFSAVFDVGGLGWNSADTAAVRFISLMLAANYPERLESLFIVNEGIAFWSLWAIAKMFMD